MSDGLSDETVAELREELERRRAELAGKSKRALDELSEPNERGGRDTVDESTDEQGTSTMLRLKDRERNLLTKISRALERIESGEYGECTQCEEPIPEKRLRARPMTLMCVECKEEREEAEEREKNRPGLLDDYHM